MFWNKDNILSKKIFDKAGTADTSLGLFFDSQACDTCPPFCCINLEGSADPINAEALECCISPEGCITDCVEFFQSIANNCLT